MKSINLEERFSEIMAPLIAAGEKHTEAAERLCRKIDRSNGQIYRAFYGMVSCSGSAIPVGKDE